jgi:methylphosphotriester-DNA--protein-cysteine methyltransferase
LARKEKVGLWAQEPPKEEANFNASAAPYVASKESDVFHKVSCPLAETIAQENVIRFNSLEEAKASARRGCKRCMQ